MRSAWSLFGAAMLFGAAIMCLGIAGAGAAETKKGQVPVWKGSAELGAVRTTGDTEEENFKLRTAWARETSTWKHMANFDGHRSSREGELTAHRLALDWQSDRKFDEKNAMFGRVFYEDDRFSGYDYQADITTGYTRNILDNAAMSLDGDVGAGVRHSELDDGTTDNEAIFRLAGHYEWQVSDNAVFKQMLSTEIGQDSTISRSETSLSTSVAGNLAMKLSYQIRHNSDVPAGSEKTDTESSVTLVYKF